MAAGGVIILGETFDHTTFCRSLRPYGVSAGGVIILGETFDHPTFRRSLGRVFASGPDGHLDCGFNATLEVIAPKVSCLTRLRHGLVTQVCLSVCQTPIQYAHLLDCGFNGTFEVVTPKAWACALSLHLLLGSPAVVMRLQQTVVAGTISSLQC